MAKIDVDSKQLRDIDEMAQHWKSAREEITSQALFVAGKIKMVSSIKNESSKGK